MLKQILIDKGNIAKTKVSLFFFNILTSLHIVITFYFDTRDKFAYVTSIK